MTAATASKPATVKGNKPATAVKPTPKVITPAAANDTTTDAKTPATRSTPTVTTSAVPPQVLEHVKRLWPTEPERRFAVKAWKHMTGIRKSQGTPHGLTKEQAAAIVARVAEFSR